MSRSTYGAVLAELRATCATCRAHEHTVRPEHVSLRSWHAWSHDESGAPDTGSPHCRCGAPLGNGPGRWHCASCHETFAGERPFRLHRHGPGDARACLDLQNGSPSRHWSDAQGVWHYGPRRGEFGAPASRRGPIPRASAPEHDDTKENR